MITPEELSKVYLINIEIKQIQRELAELEDINPYKKNIITDMPRGGEAKDKLIEWLDAKRKLELKLLSALTRLQEERGKAIDLIDEIEDRELRLIIRLRCVDCMKWKDIGYEMHMERTAAYKKYMKYFNEQ